MEVGFYKLKEEFFKQLHISDNSYRRRREDLLEWLKNFYDYELIDGRPIMIHIKEVYDEYEPLPKKGEMGKSLTAEKEKDYAAYIESKFTDEWVYTSKMKESREAIEAFGKEKYHHSSAAAVAKRYIGPAMNIKCEKSLERYWVDYPSYKPLSEEQVAAWRQILEEEHISEREAANAFYKKCRGGDTSKEEGYFKTALERCKIELGLSPILVLQYRKVVNPDPELSLESKEQARQQAFKDCIEYYGDFRF